MAGTKPGAGSHLSGVLGRSTPPEPEAEADGSIVGVDQVEPAEPEGRGATADPKPARARTRRPPVSSTTRGRKLHLPDDIHDRLWLLARQRRKTVSAVAAELLDRALPRFTISREG